METDWLTQLLACPRDQTDLSWTDGRLECATGHIYPVVDGIPVMLIAEEPETHWVMGRSLQLAAAPQDLREIEAAQATASEVDGFVQQAVGATCGYLYRYLPNRLSDYPIPEIHLDPGRGDLLLDIGCSWGRWSIAAARKGYLPIGLDPCLLSVRAAARIASQLGLKARFVVGDARHLPFKAQTFTTVFSYSVLQHLPKDDVLMCLRQSTRVLKAKGTCVIQLANKFGVRSLYWQARRGFREAVLFQVRYWSPREMLSKFETSIGPSRLAVDGYFGLGVQPADARLLPFRYRQVVRLSELLRTLANVVPGLRMVADSLYVVSEKSDPSSPVAG